MAIPRTFPEDFVGPVPQNSTYGQLPSVQTNTRNLEFDSGNPAEMLRFGQNQSESVAQTSGDELQSVMDMLKEAQRFGSNTQLTAQREQLSRGSSPLPKDLAGLELSPSQIMNFRRGEMSAVEPTIGGAKDLVSEAKSLLEEYRTTQETQKKTAASFINLALEESGADGVESLLKANPDLFKAAGYDTKTWEAILPSIRAKEVLELKAKRSSSSNSPGSVPIKGAPTANEIRDFLQEEKRKNPNTPYYDLWGQLADYLRDVYKVNPSNYDEQFWEVLHPEGSSGFKNKSTEDDIY